jgi:flagellin
MEKLSSGLRIARAADDAAGLAVSEKLRGQIRGVNAAVRAQQDSVSGLQVAEGALNEVSSMLTRAKELSIQKSGTSDSDAISAIDAEMVQIFTEIDNIETKTEYNGDALLDGGGSFSIYTDINGTTSSLTISKLDLVDINVGTNSATSQHGTTNLISVDTDGDTSGLGFITVNEVINTTFGEDVSLEDNAATPNTNKTVSNITDVSAITKAMDLAINKVATIRGEIGSYQNRFEASIRNFEGTAENLQAAESRIRDVDMAKEMVGFTKDTIIQQAAQAMLVQANQLPQNIVGLLR